MADEKPKLKPKRTKHDSFYSHVNGNKAVYRLVDSWKTLSKKDALCLAEMMTYIGFRAHYKSARTTKHTLFSPLVTYGRAAIDRVFGMALRRKLIVEHPDYSVELTEKAKDLMKVPHINIPPIDPVDLADPREPKEWRGITIGGVSMQEELDMLLKAEVSEREVK